jgi:hypothetical protein
MTDHQILELANEYLEEWEADEDGRTWIEYSGTSQKLIEFALKSTKWVIIWVGMLALNTCGIKSND